MTRVKQQMVHVYKLDSSLFKSVEKVVCIFNTTNFWIYFLSPFKSELIKEVVDANGEREKFYRFKKYSTATNKYPIFWFFWKDHWFNLLFTLKPENKSTIFLKIATPPIMEENAIKYIDLDLCMKLDESNNLHFLESEEYINNCEKLKYSNNLQKAVSKTIRSIFNLLKNKWFEKFREKQFIEQLWAQVSSKLNSSKEELLVKQENRNSIERLEIEEFE